MDDAAYMPNVVIPMVRRVYPTMMSSRLDPNERYPLAEKFVKEIGGWNFLSRRRLKHQLPNWHLNGFCLSVNRVICTDGKPTQFMTKDYKVGNPDQREEFMMDLANLADIHGIVKLKQGVIWVRQTTDPSQLNIDNRLMDAIMKRIHEECRVPFKKFDVTLKLDNIDLGA